MNIVVDENIAFAKEAFSGFGEVILMHGREITNSALRDADALVVRSITEVNEDLLRDTPVKFVGTATIGTDHVDEDYLYSKNIYFTSAAGCNAKAVKEYVFTALLKILVERKLKLKDLSIGIIGVGNIGKRIEQAANILGLKVLLNDPPRQRLESDPKFVSLEKALEADIITFHVPLNLEGIDRTVHLLDEDKLQNLGKGTIIINASRGPVIDNAALEKLLDKKDFSVVLDVWENEPDVNIDLMNKTVFATPHIAGYSLEGKVNGTKIIYDALRDFTGSGKSWKPNLPQIENSVISIDENLRLEEKLNLLFDSIYKIEKDDYEMRRIKEFQHEERAKYFDKMRKDYPFRREFNNYTVSVDDNDKQFLEILNAFGFL